MSVGASPNLYNILNVILSDVAPHSMSELYSISFTDGTSSVSSGTISLSSFQNKTIDTGGSGGGGSEVLLVSKGLTGSQGYTMNTIVPNKDMYQTSGRAIPSGYNPSSGSLTPSGNRYYWNDWNGDWFDGWGDFYIYNPSTTSASYISFANINGSDGTVYTETQTHHSKTFIIKHGWVAQGIFKLDVECSDISFQFSIGAYGNMGSDGSTQNTDIQYAASWGPLSYNYNSQSGTNEWFYSHCIPKVKTFNDGITLSSGNFTSKFRTSISGSDNLALWTDTLRVGATFYFVKGSNSSSGAMYEWVANDIVISGNLTPAIYPQILPSIDPQSEWDGTFDYLYRSSDDNFHYYGLHYIDGDFYSNNSDYDIKVDIATNTWSDEGGNHPESVDELDGTVLLYSADWPNLYKFTKPTAASWITPLNIGITGLTGWYEANSFNTSTQTWVDLSGNGNDANKTRGTVYKNEYGLNSRPIIYGGTGDGGIEFPSAAMGGAPTTYTIFTVAKYGSDQNTSGTRGRIFNGYNNSGQGNNWLSGFWNSVAGVAYHGTFITETTDIHGYSWVIGTSQHSMYRSNGIDRTKSNTAGVAGPTYFFINSSNESTTWSVAEVILYKGKHLTLDEYTKVEEYLNGKYNITTNIGGDVTWGSFTTYQYTGSDQIITVPSGKTHMKVILKGAGGGYGSDTSNPGGSGGYTEAEIELPSGTTSITLIVGQGGDSTVNTTKTYGGGGGSGNDGLATGGRGGGRTAVRLAVGGTPTTTYSSGFEWGYYNDNYHSGGYSGAQTWFSSRTPVYTHASSGRSRVTDFTNISTASSGQTSVNGDETYSYLWTGYFKAPITSTYYFNTRSDDNSHMWVGTNALNPRYDNETVDNGGLHGMQTVTSSGVSLTGGVYYDFRMTFGEEGGGDDLQAQWRNNSTSFSYDWSTVAFSNRQTSGTYEEIATAGGGGGSGYSRFNNPGINGGGLIALGGSNPNGGGGTQTTGGSGGVGSQNSGQSGVQYEGGTGSYLSSGWGGAGGGGGWYGGGGGGGSGGSHGAGGGGSGFAGRDGSTVLSGNERGSSLVYADTTQRTDSVNNCKYQNVKVLRGGGSTGQQSESGTINHGVAQISWGSSSSSSSSGGSSSSITTLAFHYSTFTSSDYSSAYSTVSDAANAGHVYSNTPSGTYTWGTLGTPSTTSNQTTYTWTPSGTITASVLMVAGGGGGGRRTGGGGGAGGLVFKPSESVNGQQTIVVGNGGTGATAKDSLGTQGKNTTFLGYTAIGGGAGSCDAIQTQSVLNGGSGGGAEWNVNTSGQAQQPSSASGGYGNNGGGSNASRVGGAGGGGAGTAGGSSTNDSGYGGDGLNEVTINGTLYNFGTIFGTSYGENISGEIWFAGGGGGGTYSGTHPSPIGGKGGGGNGSQISTGLTSGQNHTGGGGGGEGPDSNNGATGGSGIVLINY